MKTIRFFRTLALTLIFCFLVQLVPVSAMETIKDLLSSPEQQETDQTLLWDESQLSPQENDITMIGEDVEKREENVKHFRLSNGTTVAAVYPYPIHFEEEGSWVDFNHSLSLTEESGLLSRASVAASPLSISFGLSARRGKLLELDNGKGAVSLTPRQDNLLAIPRLASVMQIENGDGLTQIPYVDTLALEWLPAPSQQPSVLSRNPRQPRMRTLFRNILTLLLELQQNHLLFHRQALSTIWVPAVPQRNRRKQRFSSRMSHQRKPEISRKISLLHCRKPRRF